MNYLCGQKNKTMLTFLEEGHKYDSGDNTEWVSVTTATKIASKPFDADKTALKNSKDKKSKWYGMTPEEIKQHWKNISNTACELGNWYHKQQEDLLCSVESIEREGVPCSISLPIIKDKVKYAPDQVLKNNTIYPEHFVYLKSAGICGQSDFVEVVNNCVNIADYKTNSDLSTSGYVGWDGKPKMCLAPVSHLEDCKLTIYNLQLSMYMYIILKHNPLLNPGTLTIKHIVFEELDRDRLGTRSYVLDTEGNPVIKEIVEYKVPYLKKEVMDIIDYINSTRF
jgi:hypothetical protein